MDPTKIITETLKINRFFKEFRLEVDVYKVIKCDMDCFSPYAYVCRTAVERHYPELYKRRKELYEGYDDPMGQFDDLFIKEAQGYGYDLEELSGWPGEEVT